MSHVTQMNESCHTENGRGKQPTITKCNKTSHGPPLRHLCRPCHRHNTWRSKRRGSCGYCRRVRTQCHTVCCSTLQGVAGCSKVLCALQTGPNPVSHCVLQGVAVFKGVLGVVDGSELSATLCVTGCCSVFQCVAGCFCAFKGVVGTVDGSELSATLCLTGCCSVSLCCEVFLCIQRCCGHCRRGRTQSHTQHANESFHTCEGGCE